MKRLAYIGIRYRMLVPVKQVCIKRVEGPSDLCLEWTFKDLAAADIQLIVNARTAPKSGDYDKHDFTVVWADGRTYEGRYDLEGTGVLPNLACHIRNHMTYLRDEPRSSDLFGSRVQDDARTFLETYELNRPVVAPDNWEVVADYREGGDLDGGYRKLQAAAYGLPEPEAG